MKSGKYLLLMIMTLLVNNSFSQTVQKLFFCPENKVQESFTQKNGLENVYLLYQSSFVNPDGLTFNKELMEKNMDIYFPNKLWSGIGVLDWEGVPFNALVGFEASNASDYKKYLNQFKAALLHAKKIRPNIKWSYYAMPTRPYKQYTIGGRLWKYRSLLKECDYLGPSLYLLYDTVTINKTFEKEYFNAQLKDALELGKLLKKPVYPFVWQRYHPNSKINKNALIPVSIFTELVNKILITKNINKKVDGVIWWNCLTFLYRARAGSTILTAEFANVTNIDTYQLTLFQKYLDSIKPLFNAY